MCSVECAHCNVCEVYKVHKVCKVSSVQSVHSVQSMQSAQSVEQEEEQSKGGDGTLGGDNEEAAFNIIPPTNQPTNQPANQPTRQQPTPKSFSRSEKHNLLAANIAFISENVKPVLDYSEDLMLSQQFSEAAFRSKH